MKFENTKVMGFENAILGMRLPLAGTLEKAKELSDTTYYVDGFPLQIGPEDMRILKALIKADNVDGKTGQPNSKVLRMIHVQVCITAPDYFFRELDTYKIATVRNSSSQMHKLASTPITMDCFEMDDYSNVLIDNEDGIGRWSSDFWEVLIHELETLRQKYNVTKDKQHWKELIRLLPQSFLYTSMFDCNYETLRNICSWRSNHKLNEWSGKDKQGVQCFIDWASCLPYAKELIFS